MLSKLRYNLIILNKTGLFLVPNDTRLPSGKEKHIEIYVGMSVDLEEWLMTLLAKQIDSDRYAPMSIRSCLCLLLIFINALLGFYAFFYMK